MLRSLPWIILGGIGLIALVVAAQITGTFLYLNSPQKIVSDGFTNSLKAKAFNLAAEGSDDAANGASFSVVGAWDQTMLSQPQGSLKFSFQTGGQKFYGNGELAAKQGQLYVKFSQIAGVANVLPGALDALWAKIDYATLLGIGRSRLVPSSTGSITEADLQAVRTIVAKHIPFVPADNGQPASSGGTQLLHYQVTLDKPALGALFEELGSAIKGEALSDEEKSGTLEWINSIKMESGEVWVNKRGGTVAAGVFVFKNGASSVHINIRFSNYDEPVNAVVPLDARPLIELFNRLFGATLAGGGKLPFELPFDLNAVPNYDFDKLDPTKVSVPAGQGKHYGQGIDWLKVFYGTSTLFNGK
jgi:hypothetical protein